jgi:hypothetical protein
VEQSLRSVTAGEACGKACWENGGLSGRRGKRARALVGKHKVKALNQEKTGIGTRDRRVAVPAPKYCDSPLPFLVS